MGASNAQVPNEAFQTRVPGKPQPLNKARSECDRRIAGDSANQLDRLWGWEAECVDDESRFLGKCVGGGHVGIGRRRGVLGNQNSLWHLNRQYACVKTGTSNEALGAQASFRGGGRLLFDSFKALRRAQDKSIDQQSARTLRRHHGVKTLPSTAKDLGGVGTRQIISHFRQALQKRPKAEDIDQRDG